MWKAIKKTLELILKSKTPEDAIDLARKNAEEKSMEDSRDAFDNLWLWASPDVDSPWE